MARLTDDFRRTEPNVVEREGRTRALDAGRALADGPTRTTRPGNSRPTFQSNPLQTAILDSIGHDLRGSLAVILGTATTLLEHRASLDEAVQADLLECIREESERLNRYVRNLLDTRRLSGDSIATGIEPTDLRRLALGVAQRISRQAGSRRIEFEAPHIISVALADHALLEQALTNVLENAIAYGPDGSTIVVEVQEHPDSVSISVEDDGCGIAPEHLEAVFERYLRLDDGLPRPNGAGLGLAIAKHFVEAMGGSIRALSPVRAGRGTNMSISLPKMSPARGGPTQTT